MTDIPEWVEEKISFDNNREYQDRHLVEVFLESDRPYLSCGQVARKLGMSKEGARTRLEELVESDVLQGDSVGGARVYWIYDDRSEWPIPPDVDVVPVNRDMTVKEFVNRLHVQYGLLAVAVTMLGALFMIAFTLFLAYEIPVPVIGIDTLLVGGVLLTIVGYALLFLALVVGAWDRVS